MLQELCEKYDVTVVPTFLAFKNETKVSFRQLCWSGKTNLYHSRQCDIVLKTCSDSIDYPPFALRRTTAAKGYVLQGSVAT